VGLQLKLGTRVFSTVCSTEMIAVKAPGGPVALTIGGVAPVLSGNDRDSNHSLVAGHDGGAAMGKRYVDAAGSVELLCTKGGDGVPAVDGELLLLKDAKPLPASD
jgi:hypothetical protein